MSDYTDYMENSALYQGIKIRDQIHNIEKWMTSYEQARKSYPMWITKQGKHILIENISQNHLNNLLVFVEPNSGWFEAFKQESTYRKLKVQLEQLKKELEEFEHTIEQVYQ